MNKSNADMFINEFAECHKFGLGKGVHGTNRRGSSFLQVDLQIIRTMQSQRIGLSFAENVGIVVVLFGNVREVGDFVGDGGVRKMNPKTLRSRKFTGTDEGGCTYQEMRGAETEGFGEAGSCGGSLAALADDVGVGHDGSRSCGRKVIRPNTQSINGL